MCMESVIGADDAYTGGDYAGAKDAYIKAGEQVRYADNAGLMYIERKLRQGLGSMNRFLTVSSWG